MVYMNTKAHINKNAKRLRELIEQSGLTQEAAWIRFNEAAPKLFQPYSFSAWKSYLVAPTSTRWRPFPDLLLGRAEDVFKPKTKQRKN